MSSYELIASLPYLMAFSSPEKMNSSAPPVEGILPIDEIDINITPHSKTVWFNLFYIRKRYVLLWNCLCYRWLYKSEMFIYWPRVSRICEMVKKIARISRAWKALVFGMYATIQQKFIKLYNLLVFSGFKQNDFDHN